MSDYKTMRMKKNAQIMDAMANIRKDLYDWKPAAASLLKTSSNKDNAPINLQSPIFPAPPPKLKSLDSTLIMKRTSSMRDLKKINNNSNNNNNNNFESNSFYNKARPVSGNTKLKRLDDFSDNSKLSFTAKDKKKSSNPGNSEFITTFKSNSLISQSNLDMNFDSNLERPYLNTARIDSVKRDQNEIDQELVFKINQKDSQSVKEMDLSQFNLKEIKNLQKFQNLKILDFSCNKISKIEHMNFKNLIELRLYANQIENIENLDNLFELQSLQLQSNKIKQLNKGLNSLKKLEYLRLDQNQIESIKLNEITCCSNLIYLNVSYNNLESLGFINCLSNLEDLYASNLRLKVLNDIDPNRSFLNSKLSEVDLSNNQLDDQQVACLANFKSLSILKLANNNLKSVKNLSNLKSLRSLDVSYNQIALIQDLSNLDELEVLDVSSNNISDWFQVECLVKCSELNELRIEKNPLLNFKSFNDISRALPNLRIIGDLFVDELEDNSIDNKIEIKKNSSNEINTNLMEKELKKFEEDMQNFDNNFQKKFDEIKKYLDKIGDKDLPKEGINSNAELPKKIVNNTERLSANSKKLSKLMDALYYSKQLGDNIE